MPSLSQPETENQQQTTDGNTCNEGPVTQVTHLKLSIAEMVRRSPHLFCSGELPPPPSFTLDEWAARNPVAA